MASATVMITVADRTIGLHFGMQALMGMSADGVFEDANATQGGDMMFLNIRSVLKMGWNGYLNWCLYQNKELELTWQQFIDFIDDAYLQDRDTYNNIMAAFQSSKYLAKPVVEEEKKRPVKKK
jgi:hypothetical protein